MVGFKPEEHAMEHIRERIGQFFLHDDIRIMQLLESIQYGVLYLVVAFAVGVTLDYSFPSYNETVKTSTLFFEVTLQCLLLIVLTFYLRKLVKIVPFLFVLDTGGKSKYIPYKSEEYGGEVIIALIFLGAQFNLIKKLDLLSRRFYAWIYDEEKIVGESMGI